MTFTRFWRVHEFRVKWIVALGETTHRKDLLRRALRQRTDRTSSSSLRALPRWTFTCNLRKAWGPKMRFTDARARVPRREDRKSTRLNSSHVAISYAVFCLKKKTNKITTHVK